jgi:hypothetical protein
MSEIVQSDGQWLKSKLDGASYDDFVMFAEKVGIILGDNCSREKIIEARELAFAELKATKL